MTKTFKSVTDNKSELDVRANDCGVFIVFSRAGQIRQASTFAPSDAPALALAILEAAGYAKPFTPEISELNDYALGAVQSLRKSVALQERATAESEAKAELEAEALEFMNAVRDATGANPLTGFPADASGIKSHYLIIARKAREMRTEK